LGTTGIVNPMSEEAWKESLALELRVMAAKGLRRAVYIFGNYGEDFAVKKLGLKQEYLIKVSNFMGFMLDKAVEYGFEEILIVGHLGKLIKVAAGIFQTHSRFADARMEILAAYARP
jgi:cobalt-precorrin-5B (C1)-methyltransferase